MRQLGLRLWEMLLHVWELLHLWELLPIPVSLHNCELVAVNAILQSGCGMTLALLGRLGSALMGHYFEVSPACTLTEPSLLVILTCCVHVGVDVMPFELLLGPSCATLVLLLYPWHVGRCLSVGAEQVGGCSQCIAWCPYEDAMEALKALLSRNETC